MPGWALGMGVGAPAPLRDRPPRAVTSLWPGECRMHSFVCEGCVASRGAVARCPTPLSPALSRLPLTPALLAGPSAPVWRRAQVRERRARIYEAQGRTAEALVEYCAVLVADTVDMRKRLEPFKEHPALFQQQQMKIFICSFDFLKSRGQYKKITDL